MTRIEARQVRTRVKSVDLPLEIFIVRVINDTSIWPEVFGSRAEAEAFIRGAKAGASMHGEFIQEEWTVG